MREEHNCLRRSYDTGFKQQPRIPVILGLWNSGMGVRGTTEPLATKHIQRAQFLLVLFFVERKEQGGSSPRISSHSV